MYFKRLTFIILVSALLIGVISCKEDAVEPSLYGAIEGKVLDSETNLPISNAAVTTSPPTSSIVTDANGEFKFPSVPTGSYTISVKKSDYTSNTISISVTEGTVTEATILLSVDEGSVTGKPVLSKPANKSEKQETEVTLTWGVETQSAKDSIKYDVYLYSENSLQQERVAENLKDTLYTSREFEIQHNIFLAGCCKGG
ncbi:MAG: carboxypeptidase-like regulatory domain-containing protein [Melioribacteraceae bacterium]|nr:carboxypeptidase-like regulatory domain-containing protein [Melioribacteraceae bacterium]